MTTLHIYDPDGNLGSHELLNSIHVGSGPDVMVHVDRDDGSVDAVLIGRSGPKSEIIHHDEGCECV